MAPGASIMRPVVASTGGVGPSGIVWFGRREALHAEGRRAGRPVRLHRRGCGHGRLRAGEPSQRGSPHPRAPAGGGQERRLPLGPHPGGLSLLHRQPAHRLDDEDGARAGAQRAQPRLPARQGAGRVFVGQRHDLHARPGGGLRPLAPARQPRLGLGRRPALLPEVRGSPRRPQPDARQRRRLEGHDSAPELGDPRGRAGGGCGVRHPAPRRLQRRRQRGLGLLRGQPAERRALEYRERLPQAGDEAPQPAPRTGGRDRAADPGGPQGARSRLSPGGCPARGVRRCRGPARRRLHQLAQDPRALGHRPARAPGRARHRGGAREVRGLARTCRTTCRSAPSSASAARRR